MIEPSKLDMYYIRSTVVQEGVIVAGKDQTQEEVKAFVQQQLTEQYGEGNFTVLELGPATEQQRKPMEDYINDLQNYAGELDEESPIGETIPVTKH